MKTKETTDTASTKTTKPRAIKSKSADVVKLARKLKPKKIHIPQYDDPRLELKRLVRMHNSLTKASVALHHMGSDRKMGDTGEVIKCLLPDTAKSDLIAASEKRKDEANELAKPIEAELKKLPVYNLFLKHVYGCGPVVAGYLMAYIDINRAVKPSQLQRYCGMAVINGRFERRECGPKYDADGNMSASAGGTFNQEIRTRLYQMFDSMWKTSGGESRRTDTKYMEIWHNKRNRIKLSERVDGAKIRLDSPRKGQNGKLTDEASLNGFAHSTGWHAAAQLFLYDLYMVWRATEGLPIWTTWYDWARGYEHGTGSALPRENVPRVMSVDDVLELIGNVGKRTVAIAAE